MDELEQLESLNLIAKVCTELENHIGINDKVLGKFFCLVFDLHFRIYEHFSFSLLCVL